MEKFIGNQPEEELMLDDETKMGDEMIDKIEKYRNNNPDARSLSDGEIAKILGSQELGNQRN